MPRPNPERTIASEQTLARRLAYEREQRGMSYDGLASRMTSAGCPIQPSGLYKIEKAGRRITVNELTAMSQVFGLPVAELLVPPELAASKEALALWTKYEQLRDTYLRTADEMYEVEERLVELSEMSEGVRQALTDRYGEDAAYSIDNITFFHRDENMRNIYGRSLGKGE